MKPNGWTSKRRKQQAEMIKNWKPWEKTTGPKTEAGKKKVSQNAQKHGLYGQDFKALRAVMRKQREFLN